MHIRAEKASDIAAIRAINLAAFPTSAEADLVDALRGRARPLASLVATQNGVAVGHILFSPVTLPAHSGLRLMGLAPMAVEPQQQRSGVGSALVHAGLEACAEIGCGAVVVLGHPEFYPRFGFAPAKQFGLGCEYEVPDDVFMALELQPGYLRDVSGIVRYHPAFNDL